MTLLDQFVIKVSVAHATPLLLYRLPRQDSNLSMVSKFQSCLHSRSCNATSSTRVVRVAGLTWTLILWNVAIWSPMSVLHIKAKPRDNSAPITKLAHLLLKFWIPNSLAKVGVKSLKSKSWRKCSEMAQSQLNSRRTNFSRLIIAVFYQRMVSPSKHSTSRLSVSTTTRASQLWAHWSMVYLFRPTQKLMRSQHPSNKKSSQNRMMVQHPTWARRSSNLKSNQVQKPWKTVASLGRIKTTQSRSSVGASMTRLKQNIG